ncbi:MAG: radical SAM protein [Candidatus Fermentibacteria bacterium]
MPKYEGKCPNLREADLYTGCPFNCVYCIAEQRHSEEIRPTDREQEIFAGPASDIPLYLSPWTDPYPPCEEEHFRTGSLVRHLSSTGQPFYVITRSLLLRRDIKIICDSNRSFVGISLNTLDDSITDILEPCAPGAVDRAELIRDLLEMEGLRTVVRIDPVIPGITDGEKLSELLEWVMEINPFAIGLETMRMNRSIESRMKNALPEAMYDRMMEYYPIPGEVPVHPAQEWRLDLFRRVASQFDKTDIRACFCRATLPEQITPWDCRGGY